MRKSYLPLSSNAKCGEYSGTITSQMEFPLTATWQLDRYSRVTCVHKGENNIYYVYFECDKKNMIKNNNLGK